MIISLQIKDYKAKPFLKFLNSLDFVSIEQSEFNSEEYLTFLDERLLEYNNDPSNVRALEEVLEKLKNKFNF